MEGTPTRELVSEMRGHLENILKDAELAAVLLALLRGEYNNVPRLPKSVHKLEDMGLATIEKIPYYNAKPGSGWPSQIWKGRPSTSCSSVRWSMPIALKTVAWMSTGEQALVAGSAPLRSLLP